MAEVIDISAEARDGTGKGAARATRRGGRVPAVIYGEKLGPVKVSLDVAEIEKRLEDPGFFTHVFNVKVNGDSHEVLARDVQYHPVTDRPLHVDFMRFSATTKIDVEVPCVFINEELCEGIKRGGVLNVVRYEVELTCSPTNIPAELVFDLAGLDIGDSIHISAIQLPEGVAPTIEDRDFTIATIAAPTVQEEETTEGEEAEGEEAEGAEGEAGEEAEGDEEGGDGESDD